MSEPTHAILFDARAATRAHPAIERYVHAMIPEMIALLHDDEHLHIIIPDDKTDDAWVQHPRVTCHRIAEPFGTFKSHWKTFCIAQRVHAKIHHAPTALTPIRVPGKMVVTMLSALPVGMGAIGTWITKHALRHSRKIIIATHATLTACERVFGQRTMRRSTVLPLGVAANFYPQDATTCAAVRITYHLPEKFLLYVGSDAPRQNLTTILHALALMDSTATLPLVVVGFDSRHSALRRDAEHLGIAERIYWLGHVPNDDLPALYAAAHAYLYPRIADGAGLSVLEAMACGTPVLASALPEIRDLAGDAVKLVHPTDRQEWKRAIHSAIISLDWHDAYRDKAIACAARFSWRAHAEATLAIYRQLYPTSKHHSFLHGGLVHGKKSV